MDQLFGLQHRSRTDPVMDGNLKKNPDPRRLGAIMTKLGFEKTRMGHNKRCGYYVREHTQPELEQMRHPEVF